MGAGPRGGAIFSLQIDAVLLNRHAPG